jgi:hypothetical protein
MDNGSRERSGSGIQAVSANKAHLIFCFLEFLGLWVHLFLSVLMLSSRSKTFLQNGLSCSGRDKRLGIFREFIAPEN